MSVIETVLPAIIEKEDPDRHSKWFYGFPSDRYHADKTSVNQGALKHVLRSPMHFAHEWNNKGDFDSPVLRLGRILHAMILERKEYASYIVRPNFGDGRLKETKEAKKAFEETTPEGAFIISEDEHSKAQQMGVALLANDFFRETLKASATEVTTWWRDDATGIQCRARLDIVPPMESGVLIDIKTTEDASPDEVARSIFNNDYHLQAAHYLEAANKASGGQHYTDFIFAFVERNPPFACALYVLDPSALGRGQAMRTTALIALKEAIETKNFGGYSDKIATIDLPRYAYQKTVSEDF